MKRAFPKTLAILAIFAGLAALPFSLRPGATSPPLQVDQESMKRGEALYMANCAMCHQAQGLGVPPVFPPLAKSDWLMADRKRAILVLAEGLKGEIEVNGETYNGVMPAQMLDDTQAAEVMTFITNSWGNEAEPFTEKEVTEARLDARHPTYGLLLKANSYQALPEPPEGWVVEEVVRVNEFPTRFAGPGKDGTVFLLMQLGDVKRLKGKELLPWLSAGSYLGTEKPELVMAGGLTVGPDARLWTTSNRPFEDKEGMIKNDVVIWRSAEVISDSEPKMEPWFRTVLPYGVGPYNHGVSHLAFGPDGGLWVASGSRTDSGEEGKAPNIAKTGETELTSCIWRFEVDFTAKEAGGDPHVVARGLRNPYGFAWDGDGNLLSASNGPDGDLAEELDMIEEGKHYGFPYQYAEKDASERFYEHTPEAPSGLEFTHGLENLGPDGGKGFYTLSPHSSPGGIIWCGGDFPEPLRNRFLVTRFGNMIDIPEDTGFDVLTVKPFRNADGKWQAETHTVMARLGRPLDVLARGDGSVLILEYSRVTDQKSGLGLVPGRIVSLRPE